MINKGKLLNYTFLVTLCIGLNSCIKRKKQFSNNYQSGELIVQEGMVLFNQHCANCHNFNNVEIGPNLNGITYKLEKQWIKDFIKNPQKIISSGNERAVEQFKKFGVYMPSFSFLEDQELEKLLAFIHKLSKAEKDNKSFRPGGLVNPIKASILTSKHQLILEDFVTIPASSEIAPNTRINTMRTFKSIGNQQRVFISDLRGILYEITDKKPEVYLDLKSKYPDFIDAPGFGTGFGSFAFHPNFENNGLLYTTHTEPAGKKGADFAMPDGLEVTLQWILTEWKTSNPEADFFDTKQKRELLRVDMSSQAHGIQDLTFNPFAEAESPDYNLLFIGIGDGSLALSGHPELCDNKNNIWGSITRIAPLGTNSKNGKYGIPKDNPFVDKEGLDEIWSYGFRNPHRISWDAEAPHKMFVSNIGQHSVEEVNLIEKGGNYGWPYREGTFIYDLHANTELVYLTTLVDTLISYIPPIVQYDHDEGNAISGGFIYRGSKIKLLKGNYLFGDIARGTIFISPLENARNGKLFPIQKVDIEINGKMVDLSDLRPAERVDLRFGQDFFGDLFVFTKSNGKVYKVIDYK
jgi:mono/diheme cytochrome c family protein